MKYIIKANNYIKRVKINHAYHIDLEFTPDKENAFLFEKIDADAILNTVKGEAIPVEESKWAPSVTSMATRITRGEIAEVVSYHDSITCDLFIFLNPYGDTIVEKTFQDTEEAQEWADKYIADNGLESEHAWRWFRNKECSDQLYRRYDGLFVANVACKGASLYRIAMDGYLYPGYYKSFAEAIDACEAKIKKITK